ncbi:MAG: GNAT family N-acetyltransferase [Halanaeroarchaeum sp.]
MEFEILGHPPDGPALDLDWRRFRYAGKFVMTNSGKAVARDGDETVGAIAFNGDRSDETRAWIRYVTVRDDRGGEGIGPRLTAYVTNRLLEDNETVRAGANNVFSYQSFFKAGFGFTGETTGLDELVVERPGERSPQRYRDGLRRYLDRDLSESERAFATDRLDRGPPDRIDPPGEDT